MIPFPGESASLDWANVTAGAPFDDFGDSIRFRAGSSTVTAGDAFVVGFFDSRYLEAGADAVFSAVVETLAGSSGTLHLSGGPDPAWSLGDANASAYDLGDHAVTGAETIVVSLPWLTVADYLAEDVETAIRVEGVSGSVVVQQVKLRIWPTAGVAGGWSTEPFVQDPQDKAADILDAVPGSTTPAINDQAAMRAELATLVTPTPGAGVGNYIGSGQIGLGSGVGSFADIAVAYIGRNPSNYSGPGFEEEAWIVPPNEVRGDVDRVIFQPTGDDTYAWTQGTATLANETPEDPVVPAPGYFHVDATEVDTREPAGTLFVSFLVGTPWITFAAEPGLTLTDFTVPEFTSQYLRVTFWHDGDFAELSGGVTQIRLANGTTEDEGTFNHLRYLWTPAPYRYWNPAAVARRIPLRQYHRDDGLGVAPPRAFGGASRIRTGRAYGYD